MSFRIALNNIIKKTNKEGIIEGSSYSISLIAEKLYERYMLGLRNNFALIKNRGKLNLENISFQFDEKNKMDVKKLLFFAKRYGVQFKNKKGYWNYDSKQKIIVTPQGIKFYLDHFDPNIFSETFLSDIHFCDFNLKNKVVVQAGAFIGDTPLYYAYRGTKVYAFEPDYVSFNIAIKNININKVLAKRIVLKNYAIGNDGYLNFPAIGSGGSSVYTVNDKTKHIRCVSIKTILNEFNITKPFLLDLDIKGKEFEVIRDTTISEFEMVRIEYSTVIDGKKIGSRETIIKTLKKYGFNKIRIYKHNDGTYDLHEHGTIEAHKD